MHAYPVGLVLVTYIIHHECSNSSANLVVGFGFAMRTQKNEEKSARGGTEGGNIDKLINSKTHPADSEAERTYLVGTGTSVSPPRVVA